MRNALFFLSLLTSTLVQAQKKTPVGRFSQTMFPEKYLTLSSDSTFQYISETHPLFFLEQGFSEEGKWTVAGDTIILNPHLPVLKLVETDFKEEATADSTIMLTFYHVKRYHDHAGNFLRADTFQLHQLDFAFNQLKKKRLKRIAPMPSVRCAFAGYIPKEIITDNISIFVERPAEGLKSIFVGSYELQGFKEFPILNANSNKLTLTVFSNYYQDKQLRQKRILLKRNHLYLTQKPNGKFDVSWGENLKREKTDGSIRQKMLTQ